VRDDVPLYVDLDGTLIRSDLLWESLLSTAHRAPVGAVLGLLELRNGRAAMKQALAQRASIDVASLPYDEGFVDWLREQSRGGRRIYLATAADVGVARRVAEHLGLFEGVLASDGTHNLKGPNKLAAIGAHCADAQADAFDYCGNGSEDLVLFAAARRAIVVNAAPAVLAAARGLGNVAHVIAAQPAGPRVWMRALRVHQWLKNLLVLVPLLTAFRVSDPMAVVEALIAFLAFCLVASGGYFVNDLLDLGADRRHPTKRDRPLASGRISVAGGVGAAALLLAAGALLGSLLAPEFLGWLAGYAVLTLSYSMSIKRHATFDLIALAALYSVRIMAGGAAIEVEVSFWLLAFSTFLFFSLATVKRCAELVSMRARGEAVARGRGYVADDLEVLRAIGTATSVASVLVLALYVQSPDVAHRYASPRVLWLMLTGLLVWLSHLWLMTARGQMHDDPLVFAIRDRTSRWLIALMGAAFVGAALLR
jgi:4-hydroxybenzoate polyprenyltransferase/phosphoserine phosphatase